ncbi:MAG: lysophospholipid acyltransferase family protein [Tagaea sp.]
MIVRLRSLAFNVWFFGLTALALLISLPAMLTTRKLCIALGRLWARLMVGGMRVLVGTKVELRGRVELLGAPALVAIKHQSAWDTIFFYLVCPDPAYVLKKELLRIPIYGWMAARQGHIPVDRKAGGPALKRMLDAADRAIAEGRQILIFPQGTRVPPGVSTADHPYHPGIAGLYAKLGVGCVPVALNSGMFWGRRSFLKRPGTIVVEVLEPIAPGLPRARFMRELETRVETASAALEAEARTQA